MMALLLGQRAYSIHERQCGLEIGELIAAHDVMLVNDIPLRGLVQQTMNVRKILSFERRYATAARNAMSVSKHKGFQIQP